jgi:hypothetical protein
MSKFTITEADDDVIFVKITKDREVEADDERQKELDAEKKKRELAREEERKERERSENIQQAEDWLSEEERKAQEKAFWNRFTNQQKKELKNVLWDKDNKFVPPLAFRYDIPEMREQDPIVVPKLGSVLFKQLSKKRPPPTNEQDTGGARLVSKNCKSKNLEDNKHDMMEEEGHLEASGFDDEPSEGGEQVSSPPALEDIVKQPADNHEQEVIGQAVLIDSQMIPVIPMVQATMPTFIPFPISRFIRENPQVLEGDGHAYYMHEIDYGNRNGETLVTKAFRTDWTDLPCFSGVLLQPEKHLNGVPAKELDFCNATSKDRMDTVHVGVSQYYGAQTQGLALAAKTCPFMDKRKLKNWKLSLYSEDSGSQRVFLPDTHVFTRDKSRLKEKPVDVRILVVKDDEAKKCYYVEIEPIPEMGAPSTGTA